MAFDPCSWSLGEIMLPVQLCNWLYLCLSQPDEWQGTFFNFSFLGNFYLRNEEEGNFVAAR